MTIRHLKIFVAVNDCGGMSAAARKLYVAQPTISQAIAELEKYYGRCLFERFGKKLYITDDGKELLLYARHLLDLFEKMEREFKGNAKINKIVVGATLTIGETIMPEMVKAFKEFKPSIKCEIIIKNTCDIEKMLLASELDCAIVEGALSSQELLCQRLKTDDVILACGKTHRLYKKTKIDLYDLRDEEFLVREKGSGTRVLFEKEMASREFSWQLGWECSGFSAIIKAAKLGLGIAVLSESLISEEVQNGELNKLVFAGSSLRRSYSLVSHKNKFITPSLEAFMDVCKAVLAKS